MDGGVVRQMYLDGRRQWPLIELAYDDFERHWQARLGDAGPDQGVDGSDLLLACACAQGNAEALRVFEQETRSIARAAIAKIRRDEEFVQDCLQELWEKLLWGPNAKVKKYGGRGALKAWVRVTATRSALDRCRALGLAVQRHTELSEGIAVAREGAEIVLLRTRYAETFQSALREAVAGLRAQERNALRMHVCGGCSIDQIGRAYGVHRATAARWLERAREAIGEGVRGALTLRNVKLTDSEFQSLGHALASELELKLSGSFAANPSSSLS